MGDDRRHTFNLILRINRRSTRKWFLRVLALPVVLGIVAKVSGQLGAPLFIRGITFVVFLVVLFFSLFALIYLVRLLLTNRNRLELNEEGLYDQASFCELGFVPMSAIANIQFAWLFDREFLVVEFERSENPMKRRPGISMEIYRQLFGRNLWVPLYLFKASRVDLESQLIHLGHLVHAKPTNKVQPYRKLEEEMTDVSEVSVTTPPLPDDDRDTGFASRVAIPVPDPPILNVTSPEKRRVLDQVNQIKNKVRESGIDNKLAMLYFDHIAMFPAIAANSKAALPEGVAEVAGSQMDADYEEVNFRFHGQMLTFGLRRDIGASDEALLSFAVGGKVQSTVRVRVEIGELVPIEIESFLVGDWQSLIEQLSLSIAKLEAERMGPQLDLTDPMIQTGGDLTKTSTNLTELKNRFGIKE